MSAAAETAGVVVVAVKATTRIPRAALVWALTHVVHPGDRLTLLVVTPGKRLWGFPLLSGDCASRHRGSSTEQRADIAELCSQMMVQLDGVYDRSKINVEIKVVAGSPSGEVAAEAKRAQASWVVLDKQLKSEEKHCLDDLQCNIVAMKRSQLKVLRLNLVGAALDQASVTITNNSKDLGNSSPELDAQFSTSEAGTTSASTSPDPGTSPNECLVKEEGMDTVEAGNLNVTSSDSDSESLAPSAVEFEPWVSEILSMGQRFSKKVEDLSQRLIHRNYLSKTALLGEKFSKLDQEAGISDLNYRSDLKFSALKYRLPELDKESFRGAISVLRNSPTGSPPLCSICQHKAPLFGKPPRWFRYAELAVATDGFSQANFLAEGGYGSVHRGVLPNGQAVAVKQHKLASSQGDHEFCSEVEVLSCAQHCNVVMLIGYCAEDNRRLLVYEYICNGSLHTHLYGRNTEPLEWSARQKIAVGAARGLRYLHEDCRVGCIVHRDMRPHNILLTHDFKPLVGDFGLARCQPDGDLGEETRVIGTIGYMAPEYSQTGQITEKADVYSFGVVLIELITGRKAMDISQPKGQQLLTEWARPLLEENAIVELIDPRLGACYSREEAFCMMRAASSCIKRDHRDRPRMSQVLRILEGNMGMEPNYLSASGCDIKSRSGLLRPDQLPESNNVDHKPSYEVLAATREGKGRGDRVKLVD